MGREAGTVILAQAHLMWRKRSGVGKKFLPCPPLLCAVTHRRGVCLCVCVRDIAHKRNLTQYRAVEGITSCRK